MERGPLRRSLSDTGSPSYSAKSASIPPGLSMRPYPSPANRCCFYYYFIMVHRVRFATHLFVLPNQVFPIMNHSPKKSKYFFDCHHFHFQETSAVWCDFCLFPQDIPSRFPLSLPSLTGLTIFWPSFLHFLYNKSANV